MRWFQTVSLLTLIGCAHEPDGALDVATLRSRGPAGLASLLADYDTADAAQRARLKPAVDLVAGQKDAHVSRLYWFEDLEAAKAEARRTKRPVLSLRLLGRLDEELSCANSRFFRTTLYANTEVSAYLRQHYVLHWSSERPVPVATIDFGDGRKVTRTITGNSIHYVLDAEGRLVDALPGLYGARTFIDVLQRAERAAAMPPAQREDWHEAELVALLERFNADRRRAGASKDATQLPSVPGLDLARAWPSARAAVMLAIGKMEPELPLVQRLVPDTGATLKKDTTPWELIAPVRSDGASLDAASRALVLSKNPVDVTSPTTPTLTDELAVELIKNLETSIALDTARNEYALHAVLHRWLREYPTVSFEDFNREVYARLFLTPATDPWLGLVPALTWTALPNDGIELKRR